MCDHVSLRSIAIDAGLKPRLPDSTIPTTARPGGAQTRVKLGVFEGYLRHFAKASSSAIDRIYIDGLAGSGEGIDKATRRDLRRLRENLLHGRSAVHPKTR